ncbi:LamG-like jellyroll fold domain-containing protein, partial [Winogradskyella sp.]|uniref:LamG domain-containing protein n=1 Tax=Winogradskyella sp. TaxID=1883156 RepID=UPI003513317F
MLLLLLSSIGLKAQTDEGAKIVTVAQASQELQGATGKYTFQVGVPYLNSTTNAQYDVRFPWDILYLYGTFAEESFDISKGFFGDKILINWELRNNYDLISTLKLYRREYAEPACESCWQFVANVPKDDTEYEDEYVEGGVLYEYKLLAEGVNDTEIRYQNFITGLGFRNPTAIVTGNVSYEGGNPVKDVTLRVESQGSTQDLGSSLLIPNSTFLELREMSTSIDNTVMFQAWLKPENAFIGDGNIPIDIFRLFDGSNEVFVKTNYLEASNTLEVDIDGAVYSINNFIPSGDVDSRGNDVLIPVSSFNNVFIHMSIAMANGEVPLLFINGRAMNGAYQNTVVAIESPNQEENDPNPYATFSVTVPTASVDLSASADWDNIHIGGGRNAIFDEIRIWNQPLNEEKIRTDYRRYISGNDSRLISYLRANEGVGQFAYDFSRTGFNYNKNNGKLRESIDQLNPVQWLSGAGNVPSADQLGVLGVTDINGNYEITAIPYSGTGESFTVTPLYGLHQFDPSQQLVFLGQGSEVVNQINFTDVSSFIFRGKAVYDVRGVFPSFAEVENDTGNGNTIPGNGAILDEGYNVYDILGTPYNKGEFWLNDAGTPDDISDDYLDKYANVALEGAQIFIDSQIVLDENNQPVLTDENGEFEISVPIGNHFIRLEKNGHELVYNGRFPAETGTFYEFFEDAENQVVFIDSTRISVVGRIVGGALEAQKPIGFGENGIYEYEYTNSDGETISERVSSKNNIGVANVTLGYNPPSGNITPYTEFNFSTNSDSGEYRVDILPLTYSINETNGISVPSNTETIIDLLDANETLVFNEIPPATIPEFETSDGTILEGSSFHYEKSFTYRSLPVLSVSEQLSDTVISIDETTEISTEGFPTPIYTQFANYQIVMDAFERYINYEMLNSDGNPVEDFVPLVDGDLVINNNLALEGSESIETDPEDASRVIYRFRGGMPNTIPPFTKSLSIQYLIDGQSYPADPNTFIEEGIVLGGQSDGSQTFITAAPDIPDIILRDPPGSNSFASITEGEQITLTSESQVSASGGGSTSLKYLQGVKFGTGGGLAGPVIESETTNSITGDISLSTSSKVGKNLTKTYSFNQTISTSSDPSFVGAEGDLYIGHSKNYFYGSYDNVQASLNTVPDSEGISITNASGESLFISKQKAMYFNEEPTETFFVYSQKFIKESLIPDLELIVSNLENGIISEDDPGVESQEFYEQQINIWKLNVLYNEEAKFNALNNRDELQANVDLIMNDFIAGLENAINDSEINPIDQMRLIDNLQDANGISDLINDSFDENISFDAGVGEISRSIETIVVDGYSTEFNIQIEESLVAEAGFTFNGLGFLTTIKGFASQDTSGGFTEEETSTVNISYTLSDNDAANFLSVDVINLFDGNGPVFSTIGGQTSCPYEGPELSSYYNENLYNIYLEELQAYLDANPDNPFGDDRPVYEVVDLDETQQEQLSFATLSAEEPQIVIDGAAQVFNIPESNNAEFTLLLQNTADTQNGNTSFLLTVDNTTNPNNAIFNLAENGTVVTVPTGQTIEFTLTLGKSISDVYDYQDIRIVLQSLCDTSVFDDVLVSAQFVPSCTEVELSSPLSNWVYNIDSAYNNDGTVNPLSIIATGFDSSFNNFKKIDLEYRSAGSPTWTRLRTYYNTQEFFDDALLNGETEIELINGPELFYNFDIVDLSLQDGDYELRARSSCTNDTEYISEVISGRVDLNPPRKFGNPLPIDGILEAGEDLQVNFNENVFVNSALSTIEIKGETNQLPINNSVSVYFEGTDNTMTIENPRILTGDFSLEFWMKNATVGAATILNQNNGINLELNNNQISFTIDGLTASGGIATDGLFHHYTVTLNNQTGELQIFEDDQVIGANTGNPNLQFTNQNTLVLGGNNFVGNIHDLRIWGKTFTLSESYANIYTKILGNEPNLLGAWPMNEGRGNIAYDLAYFKHAQVNADWDIKPKGDSYEFNGNQYLELDNLGFVQLTSEMDATMSFWLKTDLAQEATMFSNGRGNGDDVIQSNGLSNKWAINMNSSGQLSLESEGNSLLIVPQNITDNNWHHISILINRNGSIRTYLDSDQVSSNNVSEVGGFSGNTAWLGARGYIDLSGTEIVDRIFNGKIDEFRLWSSLRNVEQITRDQFNEVDLQSTGLVLYSRFNEPEFPTGNGPTYYHTFTNQTIVPTNALLSSGSVNYSEDVPPIKPARDLIDFQVSYVINEDQIILEPVVSDWAVLEGQVLDITVHRMFDDANNMQQSPITWTAFVQQNDVSWYVEGYNEIVDIVSQNGEETSFDIIVVNRGGVSQPYSITNVPSWLSLSESSGVIPPDSEISISASVDSELAVGEYLENLYLQTDFGFDQIIQLDLRILGEEPDWEINPNDFDYSMNIVGKIKIEGVFSEDLFDKVAAFVDGDIRGETNIIYETGFQEYFVFLTIYSNTVSGESVDFKIYDASSGNTLFANIDGQSAITFSDNNVLGTLNNFITFESTNEVEQTVDFNQGWTWVSFNVNSANFDDLNLLTSDMMLSSNDRIKSIKPTLQYIYTESGLTSGWNGTSTSESGVVTQNPALSNNFMYKVYLDESQELTLSGVPVDNAGWSFQIEQGWNYFPFPLTTNLSIDNALSNFNALEGDVIKSQNLFAIYDDINGWSGTLNYLEKGQGFMLRSNDSQEFQFPTIFNRSNDIGIEQTNQRRIEEEFALYSSNMNAVVLLPEGFDELFVFDSNNNLKGVANNQTVG